MTAEEILDYVKNTSSEGKEQVYGYIDGLFEKDITNYVSSAKTITNADGTTTTKIDKESLEKIIKDNTKVSELGSILGGYDYTTKAGDSTVNIKVNDKGEVTVEISESKSSSNSYETIVDETTGKELYYWTDNHGGNAQFNYIGTGDDYSITVKDTEYKVTVIWGDYVASDGANGYTLKQIKEVNKELKEKLPKARNGDIVYYNNSYWIYQTDGKEWGLLVTGEDQDKKASDAEKLITDLYK